mmetsp:Transcript_11384/g.22268  ORF Transcript_11384/g.22268 Transcript_11384/m.22268 type:complete len:274 (-) Transcript_11384:934-1755(-)
MYALLPWPGYLVTSSPELRVMSTGSKGDPLTKMARPSDHLYACSAVHSALEVGLLRAKTRGASLISAMYSIMLSVKVLGMAQTPMMAVGFMIRTACSSEVTLPSLTSHSVPATFSMRSSDSSWAKSSLWCWSSPLSPRVLVTSPLLSTSQIWRLASSSEMGVMPSSTASSWMACAMRLAIPVPASPAPINTKVWSRSFFLPPSTLLVTLSEARTPASETAAVPWISSLKVVYELRVSSRSLNALVLSKSSNWIKRDLPQRFWAAAMNSLTRWS